MLPGVRGDDDRSRADPPRHEIERARVDDDGHVAVEDASERHRLVGVAVGGIRSRPDEPRLHATVRTDRLGASGENERQRAIGAEIADHAHPGSVGRFDTEDGGPRVALRSGAHTEHAAGILVVVGGWPPQEPRRLGSVPDVRHGATLSPGGAPHTAREIRTRPEETPA